MFKKMFSIRSPVNRKRDNGRERCKPRHEKGLNLQRGLTCSHTTFLSRKTCSVERWDIGSSYFYSGKGSLRLRKKTPRRRIVHENPYELWHSGDLLIVGVCWIVLAIIFTSSRDLSRIPGVWPPLGLESLLPAVTGRQQKNRRPSLKSRSRQREGLVEKGSI